MMKLLVEVNIFLKRIFLPPKPELCWETLASWEGCMVFWIFFLVCLFWFCFGFLCLFLVVLFLFSHKSPMASELASISVSTLISAFFLFFVYLRFSFSA